MGRVQIVTQTHGSSEWVRRYNLALPDLANFETEALERSQIELSDLVVSPSRYMLDWYRGNGVNLPKRTDLINWVLPDRLHSDAGASPLCTRALAPGGVREIIFFGRQERRKGIEIFVEAIRRVKLNYPYDITFLGGLTASTGKLGGLCFPQIAGLSGQTAVLERGQSAPRSSVYSVAPASTVCSAIAHRKQPLHRG